MTRLVPAGLAWFLAMAAAHAEQASVPNAHLVGAVAMAAAPSQASSPPELIVRGPDGRVTLRAVSLAEPLRIDGRLEEALYREVIPISDFIQVEPQEGSPATERTELWLAFDRNNVYIAFRCFETDLHRVVAREMRRDHTSIWNGDDNVSFIFDTFLDRRNGVEFTINPLGGRIDGQTTNERQWSGDWNTIWDVRTGRFDRGWTVEAAIPFKSLRYRPGTDQVWGFNAFRTNRWKNELSFLVPVPQARGQQGLHMVSLAAPLHLAAPPVARNLELKPYLISTLQGQRTSATMRNELGGDFGIDAKYGVSQNITADLTYNTDFAQVEADQQQINLTRFSLFFPEKREFFLENSGTFAFAATGAGAAAGSGETPILFYSRRIGLEADRPVSIHGGARLTGRLGRYSVGLLNVRTAEAAVSGAPATNYSVARIKRDVLGRSSIGLMATGRNASGGSHDNLAYGADAALAFYANLTLNAYWARTRSTGLAGRDTSYRGQLDYAGDRYGVQFERLMVGDSFRPGIGYVRRPDIRRTFGQLRFSPRPRASTVVRKYSWTAGIALVEDGAGRLESRERGAAFGIDFENADRLNVEYRGSYELLRAPFRIAPALTLPIGSYAFDSARVAFNRASLRRISGNLAVEYGAFYDGRKTTVAVSSGRANMGTTVSFEPSYSLNKVDLVQGSFTMHLAGSRLTWTPTPLMFTSALVQYNSGSRSLSANVRYRWEYRPGSELFVVYNEERDTGARRFPDVANRAFIVKVNRLVRF